MGYVEELEKHIEELKDKYAHLECEYPRMCGEYEFYKSRSPQWFQVDGANAYVYKLGKIDFAKVWQNPNQSYTWALNVYNQGKSVEGFKDYTSAKRCVERIIFGGREP